MNREQPLPPWPGMLQFAHHSLPAHDLTYAAFRLACLDTRERLELAYQLDLNPDRNFGFLMEVPFLRTTPAQIQLELLLQTWRRHLSLEPAVATLLDESVLYAACETAARVVRHEPEVARRLMARGPQRWDRTLDRAFADDLQKLHLTYCRQGSFLLLSQFQDLPPSEAAPLKNRYGLEADRDECLFDVLSRWYVSPDSVQNAAGLLTRVETEQLQALLTASGCCFVSPDAPLSRDTP